MKLKFKKPLVILTILAIVFCTIGVCYFNARENDLFTEEQIELTNSEYQEDESLIDSDSAEKEEIEEESVEDNIIENEEITNNSNEIESENNNSSSSTNSSDSNSTTNSSTSNNNNQTSTDISKTEESNSDIIEEDDDKEINSDIIEENNTEDIEETDDDYESRYNEALKEVEYATHAECLAAAFTIGIADTVNIYGIDCVELNFEGVSIGYKIYIHYSNPLE